MFMLVSFAVDVKLCTHISITVLVYGRRQIMHRRTASTLATDNCIRDRELGQREEVTFLPKLARNCQLADCLAS
jgi:hypothetical protein